MRRAVNICSGMLLGAALCAAQTPAFDPTDFVVVGEGLAAGMADFSLRDVYQDKSFPAQMARQMSTAFPQPLIQPPGIGNAPGFAPLPVRLPGILQGSVREPFPPGLFVLNLSVPGASLSDALNRRPSSPLIQPMDVQQTVANMILGYPSLITGTHPLWTQAEYAVQMNPTLALVELGYYEIINAAVADDSSALPDVGTFSGNYASLLSRLRSNSATVIATTIPDPFDTAYFTSIPDATTYLGAPPALLSSLYGFAPDSYLSPNGLSVVGDQIFSNLVYPPFLPAGVNISAATATAVHARVAALNSAINTAASAAGVKVYDLHAFFATMKANGLTVGSRQLTASYLGGIYSLDGYYPGTIGQTAIANDLLTFLNSTYKTSFKTIDLTPLLATDPAVRFTPALHRRVVRKGLK
jgi:hypothetical protein